jgi:diaminopimelate decarboxylase
MAERAQGERLLRAAARLAKGRSTPFYLFDPVEAGASARRWNDLARAHGNLEIFYPYKCNRHPALTRLFAREGLGAEVTSPADLSDALVTGLPGERVVFQGPAKDRASLDRALGAGALIVADGPEDGAALRARARAVGKSPRYLLRLRPEACEAEQRPFGMSAREAFELLRRLVREGRALPRGLAFHLGTGLSSARLYLRAIREAGCLAAQLGKLGVQTKTLDVGGGFAGRGGSRRDAGGRLRRPPPRLEVFVSEIMAGAHRALPGARILVEPGRALAGDCFHLVTRVLRVRGRRVYVDASRMSHAFFVARGKHPFTPIPMRERGAPPVTVAGPLAVGLDVLSESEAIGRPREGDLVVIGSVGAYNLIAANAWAGPTPEVVELERA